MGGADEDDAQVHPEVEDLEDLRLGERQHHDPAELGQRDAGEDLKMGFQNQCCQMAKIDPFLSLDCARVEDVGAQSKERKGSNFAA